MKQSPLDSPFGHASTALEVVDGIDLSGKMAIVTGASSGLGVETAKALASAGAEVFMPVRNRAKGEGVAEDIRSTTGNDRVEVMDMDLFVPSQVRTCAESFLARGGPLHILINNAGIMACPLLRTSEGWESQFATNHFGHFLFTQLLLPALERGAPSRVVNLSSIGHRITAVDFDDPHYVTRPYDKWNAYGQAKTANVLFSVGFNARYADRGVTANAVHPGGIMTGLQKDLTQEEMNALGWFDEEGNVMEGFKTPEGGAATATWAATTPLLEGQGGLYLEDCNVAAMATPDLPYNGVHPHAIDPDAAERLWKLSEEMLAQLS
ncbi:MAG: oxidoreductase [Gemmatimonadota bacterium]|nr:oxidoreductase [Gemmatimonadota bacterium]MDH3422744.1 oxidoreductase [Gemmatimonadota bacterium]